jgi:hypothetical protein
MTTVTGNDGSGVISVNVEPDYFSPADAEVWNEAYQKYISIIKK